MACGKVTRIVELCHCLGQNGRNWTNCGKMAKNLSLCHFLVKMADIFQFVAGWPKIHHSATFWAKRPIWAKFLAQISRPRNDQKTSQTIGSACKQACKSRNYPTSETKTARSGPYERDRAIRIWNRKGSRRAVSVSNCTSNAERWVLFFHSKNTKYNAGQYSRWLAAKYYSEFFHGNFIHFQASAKTLHS